MFFVWPILSGDVEITKNTKQSVFILVGTGVIGVFIHTLVIKLFSTSDECLWLVRFAMLDLHDFLRVGIEFPNFVFFVAGPLCLQLEVEWFPMREQLVHQRQVVPFALTTSPCSLRFFPSTNSSNSSTEPKLSEFVHCSSERRKPRNPLRLVLELLLLLLSVVLIDALNKDLRLASFVSIFASKKARSLFADGSFGTFAFFSFLSFLFPFGTKIPVVV